MDEQLKAKWVEALRSEQFKQETGHLHDPKTGGYCCLGVLCKVMGAEFGSAVEHDENEDEWISHDFVPHIGEIVLGKDEELKPSFCAEIGIPDQFELIKMNDGYGEDPDKDNYVRQSTFPEIADYIEKNL